MCYINGYTRKGLIERERKKERECLPKNNNKYRVDRMDNKFALIGLYDDKRGTCYSAIFKSDKIVEFVCLMDEQWNPIKLA